MTELVGKTAFGIRKELIVADFKTYHDSIMNYRERISAVRQWEVTLFAAILGLTLTQAKFPVTLLLGILAVFALMEINLRGRLRLLIHIAKEIEDIIMSKDDEFIVANYLFANTRWLRLPLLEQAKYMVWGLYSSDFATWNASLLILLTLLAVLPR